MKPKPAQSSSPTFFGVFTKVFVMVMILTVAITFVWPQQFAGTVLVRDTLGNLTLVETNEAGYDPRFVQTPLEILQSQPVLTNVIATLDLSQRWGKRDYNGATLSFRETLEVLRRHLQVQPVTTNIFAATVCSPDGQEAAAVANAIAKSYQDFRLNVRKRSLVTALEPLLDQSMEAQAKLQAATSNLNALRIQLRVRDDHPNSNQPASAVASSLATNLTEAQTTYSHLAARLTQLKALDTNSLPGVLATETKDSVLTTLLTKHDETAAQYGTLHGLDNDPKGAVRLRLNSQLEELNHEVNDRVAGIMLGLETQVEARKADLDTLSAAGEQAKVDQQQQAAREQPYWDAKRQLTDLSEANRSLSARIELKKLDLQESAATLVEIISPAVRANSPVQPNQPVFICIGALAGILLAWVGGFIAVRTGKLRH